MMNNRHNVLGKQLFSKLVSFQAMRVMKTGFQGITGPDA